MAGAGNTPAVTVSPAPGPREAAAITAAIQRFQDDTAIPAPTEPAGMDPWLKAALEEGVMGAQAFGLREPFGT